jgi:hypothetical protein
MFFHIFKDKELIASVKEISLVKENKKHQFSLASATVFTFIIQQNLTAKV